MTEVTYLGFVYGTMAALKSMRPRKRGRIIQIGSALAYRGHPAAGRLLRLEHAIRGFTNSLRAELIAEGSGISVSIIELPAVNTPQFDWARVHLSHTPRPMEKPVEPEVVADFVYRVSHGMWREYWLGRSTILLILGNFVLPGALDDHLARTAIKGQQTKTPALPGRPDNLEHPITPLHRTRGSFSEEAQNHAPLVIGEVARLGTVVAGAFVFFVACARLRPSDGSELAAPRHRPDPVRRAAGDRLDRQRRIDAADRRKHRAVADPEIGDIPVRQSALTTLVAGSSPMRAVPFRWQVSSVSSQMSRRPSASSACA